MMTCGCSPNARTISPAAAGSIELTMIGLSGSLNRTGSAGSVARPEGTRLAGRGELHAHLVRLQSRERWVEAMFEPMASVAECAQRQDIGPQPVGLNAGAFLAIQQNCDLDDGIWMFGVSRPSDNGEPLQQVDMPDQHIFNLHNRWAPHGQRNQLMIASVGPSACPCWYRAPDCQFKSTYRRALNQHLIQATGRPDPRNLFSGLPP